MANEVISYLEMCAREGTSLQRGMSLGLGGIRSTDHLASDYIHPTPRGGRCRVRIYLPDERDAPVVIFSELPNNDGSSITYFAHQIAAEVIRSHELPTPLVWDRALAQGHYERWGGDVRASRLLELQSGGACSVSRGDEGMDRGCNLEEVGPRHHGGVGGREGIECSSS
jgi:hypothetical protein